MGNTQLGPFSKNHRSELPGAINQPNAFHQAVLAVMADGSSVTTIEGLTPGGGALHPIQAAFHEYHALQCGFCTAGMIMSVRQLLKQNPHPTESEIRHNLTGNICRCTGYTNIVRAVASLAAEAHGHD